MKRIHNHIALCREVARHLQDQLDAGLRSHKCREIRKHLRQCANCTAYLDSLKKTILLYRRYPDPRVPARMREKLLVVLDLSELAHRNG